VRQPHLALVRPSRASADDHADDQADSFAQFVAIAQAEEKAGRRHSARIAFEQALMRIRTPEEGRHSSNVLRWVGRLHHFEGDAEAALDCLDAAIAVAEAWNDDASVGNAMNVQAVVSWQRGELDEAERLYLLARERAVRAGDSKLAAMTAQNLGVLANIRGDFNAAEVQYRASLAEYRSLGLANDVCVALNNLGLLFIAQEKWSEAQAVLLEGTQICEVTGDVVARTQLDINLADLWIKRGDFARAQGAVRQALAAAGQTGDASAIGKATKLLGVIARETGSFEEAERLFVEADELATARGELLLQAEIARDRADLARRTGRNRDVLQQLNRAHRLFSQLRAQHDLTDIGERVGNLEQEFLHVARRWGESIEAKDRYTQGHCRRVAELACAIAAHSGFDEKQLFWFRIGALLHDVGKLVIPPEVLNKPGKLDDEEWHMMKSHTTAGVEMLGDIEFPWDVRPMVQSHHERWDGKGYPHGLAGEDIPLVARILMVADVYDALTSVRSYKRAHSHQDAMEMLRKDIGTMFDPTVFEWFERVAGDWPSRLSQVTGDEELAPATDVPDDIEELDGVTQMPMRRAFREIGTRLLEARQATGRPVSLLLIDIDDFRGVKDSGSDCGEQALQLVAEKIRMTTRPSDHLARYADDEFVILLPGTRLEDAVAVAERIRETVANTVARHADRELHVTISVGVSCTRSASETLDTLFGAADKALFTAKQTGRDTVAIAERRDADQAEVLPQVFAGRQDEQLRLRAIIGQVASGNPHLVIVRGEAGSGKSTLLKRCATDIGMRGGALLVGRCLESGASNAYGPWADIILAAHRAGLVEARQWQELALLVPELRHESLDAAGVASGGSQRALLLEIEEFLRIACASRPLMVNIEGLQWADAASWDVLEFLLARMRDQRLLLGATVRLEDLSVESQRRLRRLSRSDRCSEVDVQRLTRDELSQWLSGALNGQPAEEALLDYLLRQSEGNAFFAVQTLRALVDDRHLVATRDGWKFKGGFETTIPRPIDDLLARRIDGLTPEQREVLALAAVLGREFDSTALLAAYGGDESCVHDALDVGLANGVLTTAKTSNPRVSLRFTHALLTRVLLEGMNPLRRRSLHARVARAMEGMSTRDPRNLVSHYDIAGLSEEAFRTALEAGESAQAVFAYDNASEFFLTALRNATGATQVAQVEWRLAQVEESRGRFSNAEESCRRVLDTGEDGAGSVGLLGPARRMELRLRLQRGVPAEEIIATCSQYLAATSVEDDPSEASSLLILLSSLYQRLGDVAHAEESARSAVLAAERTAMPTLIAEAVNRLGSAIFALSPANAIPHYRRALDTFSGAGDRIGQMKCHINIGSACDRAGNLPTAEASYLTAIDIGRETRARDLSGVALLNLGVLQVKTGKLQEARNQFDESSRLFTSLGHEPYRLVSLYNLGHLARVERDSAGALELYSTCVSLAATISQIDVHVGAISGAGLAQLDMRRLQSATRQLEQANEAIADRVDWWFQGRELYEALAVRVHQHAQGASRAQAMLLRALDRSEAHDAYATLWLAAECADLFIDRVAQGARDRLLLRARTLGYAPLVARLARGSRSAIKVA
jgi:diguanylate cyclase (GGDEF)-like protein/putative nucleotidyltransferase with HDIG domain